MAQDFISDQEASSLPEFTSAPISPLKVDNSAEIQTPDFIPDSEFKSDEAAKDEKYGSTGQMALTALESGAKGLVGPIAPALETGLGLAKEEDIRGREETNPLTSGISEAVGFIAPTIATLGGSTAAQAAARFTQMGAIEAVERGLAKAGFKAGETLASRIGVGAAKGAITNMLLTGSDEVSKMLLHDPKQSAETAISHIGLAAALGSALGGGSSATSELWEKTVGDKAVKEIENFKARIANHQGEEYISPESIQRKDNVFSTRSRTKPEPQSSERIDSKPITTEPVSEISKPRIDIDKTPGAKLADLLVSKGLGAAVGGTLAHAVGMNKAIGALIGSAVLGPFTDKVLPGLAKKLLDSPTSAAGFKAAADFGIAVAKGESLATKAAKNIFVKDATVLAENQLPTERDREKLNKYITESQQDPAKLMNRDNPNAHYMPEHTMAVDETLGNVIMHLSALKTSTDRKAPLDSIPIPSTTAKAKFTNALNIAQQPLLVLDKIKKGTLTGEDIQHMGAMYPQLYNGLKTKIGTQMTDHIAKHGTIPYKTRIGLSMFMAQPLDSTMDPMAIMAAQPKDTQSQQPQQNPQSKGSKSAPALQKMPGIYQTPEQKREERKQK